MKTADKLPEVVQSIIGLPCCNIGIGARRTFKIGFGELISVEHLARGEPFRGEWEMGSYHSAWRVVRDGKILCGLYEPVESRLEIDAKLKTLELGRFESISHLSSMDVRVTLSNGVAIEFMWASTLDSEMFHIFGPNNRCYLYTIGAGWREDVFDRSES